jgi:hypothetical protein
MLTKIETSFQEVITRSEELEKEYSIPQQQTQIKDIQLRTQRVSRLIQVNIIINLSPFIQHMIIL